MQAPRRRRDAQRNAEKCKFSGDRLGAYRNHLRTEAAEFFEDRLDDIRTIKGPRGLIAAIASSDVLQILAMMTMVFSAALCEPLRLCGSCLWGSCLSCI